MSATTLSQMVTANNTSVTKLGLSHLVSFYHFQCITVFMVYDAYIRFKSITFLNDFFLGPISIINVTELNLILLWNFQPGLTRNHYLGQSPELCCMYVMWLCQKFRNFAGPILLWSGIGSFTVKNKGPLQQQFWPFTPLPRLCQTFLTMSSLKISLTYLK